MKISYLGPGSCFCSGDGYCLCTPALAVDVVVEYYVKAKAGDTPTLSPHSQPSGCGGEVYCVETGSLLSIPLSFMSAVLAQLPFLHHLALAFFLPVL